MKGAHITAAAALASAWIWTATATPLAAPASRDDAGRYEDRGGLSALLDHDLAVATRKLSRTAGAQNDMTLYPRSTAIAADGSEIWMGGRSGIGDWTAGFFPGALWLAAGATGDQALRAAALHWTVPLARRADDARGHDLGFVISASFGNAWRTIDAADDKERAAIAAVLRRAAASLASRYDPTVGAIRSWDFGPWRFPVIVDSMMNLELLFQAARLPGGDPEWRREAIRHGRTVLAHHMRPDGSFAHLVDFDPASGRALTVQTVQGYANGSTWARGQAWALYGFATAYRETGIEAFRTTACAAADLFLARLPADGVPPWDFDAPDAAAEGVSGKDSSAAAIAASGLAELARYAATAEQRVHYRRAAAKLVRALSSEAYLASAAETPAILRHGTGDRPHGDEIDVSLIYGDYYFVEALVRLRTLLRDEGGR
jgi:unsaturated chondroitin disaccharide hydrolase